MKRYHVTTFGCQMNEHDSERMKGMLESLGYAEAPERAEADLILFNTCSIRESADSRFIAHLGEAKRLKRERPERIVGVGGCWAQSVKDEVFERFPFVDVAFGPGQVHKLARVPDERLAHARRATSSSRASPVTSRRAASGRSRAGCRSASGCNCACSYCIVPSTRGREVSRPARGAPGGGAGDGRGRREEVTLLGQNVNSYGRDLRPRASFAELLTDVDAIEGIERIRYTSPHPKDMREDVIRAHAELESVCEHIHLPLQSGSSARPQGDAPHLRPRALPRPGGDDPRARPRRGAHDGHHRGLPGGDRRGLPRDPRGRRRRSATTARSRSSSRRGAAPRRPPSPTGLVPHPLKVERMEELVELVQRKARERAQRFVGRTLEVLVEGPSRTDPERLRGRTRHNKVVNFSGLAAPGELTDVEIRAATSQTLSGEERLLARAAL